MILDAAAVVLWLAISILWIELIDRVQRRRVERRAQRLSGRTIQLTPSAAALLAREPDDGEPIEEPSSYPDLWRRYG